MSYAVKNDNTGIRAVASENDVQADEYFSAEYVEPVHVPAVPERVTMRQAKEALILAGLDDDIEIALNAIQDPIQKKLALCQWRESNEMHRDMPLVQQIGAALGLSEQAIDDLFVEASKR